MLADHNAVGTDVPHLRGTVPTGFELVIELFPFVGTLDRGAALVNQLPLLGPAKRLREQTEIVAAERVVGSAKLGGGTAAGGRAPPLPTVLGFVEAIGLHFVTAGTNRNPGGRNRDFARGQGFRASRIEINKRLNLLGIQKVVNGLRIMSSIQKHFVDRAQGESLLKFSCADDQTNRIMPRGRLKSGVEWQIMWTIRCRDHVQMVPVKVLLPGAVPAGVAIRLRNHTRMRTVNDTAGAAIARGLTSGIGGGDERCAITGCR